MLSSITKISKIMHTEVSVFEDFRHFEFTVNKDSSKIDLDSRRFTNIIVQGSD